MRSFRAWAPLGLGMILALLASSSLLADESLYNGIRLAKEWPPEIRHFSRDPMPVPYLTSSPEVIPIDVGRQLFVDDFLIETTTLTRSFHAAEIHPESPVLVPDQPWECSQREPRDPPQAMPFSDGVWYDPADRLFKMWYLAGWNKSTCYATSEDGIHWKKPSLGIVPGTNIVQNETRDSATIWFDHLASDTSQRYKMMRRDDVSRKHMLHFSPDGIVWSAGVSAGNAFDRSTFFFNPFRNIWVFSLRGDSYWGETESATDEVKPRFVMGQWIGLPRLRRYREGRDFIATAQSWPSEPVRDDDSNNFKHWHIPAMWVWADRLDAARPDIGTAPELYNLDAVGYESLMLGLFTIWRGHTSDYPARDKINNVCVGFSRDGFHWHRPSREPFIDVSEDSQAWNYCNMQSAGGCCLIVGDKLHFYVSGRMTRDITKGHGYSSTGLATLRRDGFASMDAGADGGELVTRPIRFSGNRLFVNVANPEGKLQVEALDKSGRVIPPFDRKRSESVRIDSTCHEVRWRDAPDLSTLAHSPVRFRFYLTAGSLYSFWVTSSATGASRGFVAAGGPGLSGPADTVGQILPEKAKVGGVE